MGSAPRGVLGAFPWAGELGKKDQGLGGSDTHRSNLSTATTSTFTSEVAPPNALLSSNRPSLPAPAGLRHLPRVHAPLSAKRHRLRPFPAQAHTHPGLKLASTSPAPTPALPVSSAPVNPLLPPFSAYFTPSTTLSSRPYLGALSLALQVPRQWTLLDDPTILHNSRAPLFYMSRSSQDV